MNSCWGKKVTYSLFGESHGKGVGITIHGLDSGIKIDQACIARALERRKPGKKNVSSRRESDKFLILSGEKDGYTTGAPLTFYIPNEDSKSSDYKKIDGLIRPSHADYVNIKRNGEHADTIGGGHFSGRLTAPIVAAGAFISSVLRDKGIEILYHISKIGHVEDACNLEEISAFDALKIMDKRIPMYSEESILRAENLLESVAEAGDSIGAKVSCSVKGLEPGLGEPFFNGLESTISSLVFSIPGVKAIEFGAGTSFSNMKGSLANDPFTVSENKILTTTNNSGGINGGMTNGMPLTFSCTFRPTPSISIEQSTVDIYKLEPAKISISGRHDPCIAIRGCVAVASVVAIAIYDVL